MSIHPRLGSSAIILRDLLLLTGLLSLLCGIARFFEQKLMLRLSLTLFFSFVFAQACLFFLSDQAAARIFVSDVSTALFSTFALFHIYKHKTKAVSSATTFISIVFVVHFIIHFFSSAMLLTGLPSGDIFSASYLNLLKACDLFFVNLLLTVGFVTLINQKVIADITDIKMHFEQIVNTTPDAVALSRLSDGMYIDCNPSFKIVSGYSREEVIGKTSAELNIWKNPADREVLAKSIRETGGHPGFETSFIRKDGSTIVGFLSAKLLTIKGGAYLLTMTRDITSRKITEEALRVSEEQHRLLIQTALEAIVVLVDRRIVFFNPMMITLTGYADEELLQMDARNLIHPDYSEIFSNNYSRRLSGGDAQQRYNVQFLKKSGEIRWAEIGGVRITWRGNPATLTFIYDVTDKKLAELETLAAKNKLEKINAEKDKFFSIIAHDLRSPFMGLLGLTEIMAEDAEKMSLRELKSLGSELHKTANNLYKLLRNLLEWAQMQQGAIQYKPKPLSLEKIIAESIEALQTRSTQKEIAIVNSATDPIQITADERMLSSILLNLLSNAVKFTHRKGKIFVSAQQPSNDFLEISIRDTGVGMSSEDIGKLFKLDVKLRSAGTEGEQSTGLGLLLCKEFVERMGGKIWVESEEGIGSSFLFSLPHSVPR
jgi:hypothetical protein